MESTYLCNDVMLSFGQQVMIMPQDNCYICNKKLVDWDDSNKSKMSGVIFCNFDPYIKTCEICAHDFKKLIRMRLQKKLFKNTKMREIGRLY